MSARANPSQATACLGTALVLLLLSVGPVDAQTVVGRVADERDGRPLRGAFLRLADSTGTARAADFTDAEGRFRLPAPGAGRYRLHVERIGFVSDTVGSFRLEEHTGRRIRVSLSRHPVRVSDLAVDVRSRCRDRPSDAKVAHRLWSEIRKALRQRVWSERIRGLRVVTRQYLHRTGPDLEVEETVREWRDTVSGPRPFHAADPEKLARDGFVEVFDDSTVYYGPDARTLLSRAFVETHCFGVRASDDGSGRVGVTFRPRDGRDLPDVEGVLWLDRESSELREIEFRYTNLPYPAEPEHAGGRVEYFRLAGGPWIIRRWQIRTPLLSLDLNRLAEIGGREVQVRGYALRGGSVAGLAGAAPGSGRGR